MLYYCVVLKPHHTYIFGFFSVKFPKKAVKTLWYFVSCEKFYRMQAMGVIIYYVRRSDIMLTNLMESGSILHSNNCPDQPGGNMSDRTGDDIIM